ncbi:response regulator [Massilia sp. PWRC2]|uniref:response regulator n=1 Tax=Massilia sp. PWRC2 TaxID=2804626 RepID=UPI003CEE0E06
MHSPTSSHTGPGAAAAAAPARTPAKPAGAGGAVSVLVIDPNPGMRASLHTMLTNAGIANIEFAVSAGSAIRQLLRRPYDVVLCEYDLGGGSEAQDGQHLLEDLRQHKLIAPQSIFIMLTAEAVYGKVVSAAELAPTDYVLKPCTADVLSRRIERALDRRAALQAVHQLIDGGDLREALRLCAAGEIGARYGADFARLRAELHAALGDFEGAASCYQAMLAAHPSGWAHLGLARTRVAQQRHAEALTLLDALVVDQPRLMAAYDLLAQCHSALAAPQRAQQVLQDALAISPHLLRRLRTLGAVALDGGDVALAEKSFRQVLARARYSEFRDPEDHLNLVRALVQKGDTEQAGAVVRDLEKALRAGSDVDACAAWGSALLLEAAGNGLASAAALGAAVAAAIDAVSLTARLKIGLARHCLRQRLDRPACSLVLSMTAAAHGALAAAEAVAIFSDAGRADLAESMATQLAQQAQALADVAATQTRDGDLKGAVHSLLEARLKSPASVAVTVAALGAILRQLDELGWDHALAERVAGMLEAVRHDDGAQFKALQEQHAQVRRKYGIAIG